MLPISGRAIVGDMRVPLLAALLSSPAGAAEPVGRWVWGDTHAHSGWSFDGCEDPDQLCASRGATPASDFFAVALENGLDFAALTDHAEAGAWSPDGADGDAFEIWQGQAAEGAGVLPILGYEWTGRRDDEKRGHPRGSHRTVLLDNPSSAGDASCEAARIAGFVLDGGARTGPDGIALYTGVEEDPVEQVSDLWRALDDAAEACPGLGWLTFAHHSAYTNPQVTDWSLRENRPDAENLIEIASEHGSSECVDTSRDGCDWWINQDQGYWPDGSVQAALEQGFMLGFVGGTDSHDARPGSLEDGPGPVAHLEDGEVRRQFARGAITGVFLEGDEGEGPPSLNALFDALNARHTVASTGPRPEMTVSALGADGQSYLPGEVLPPSAFPAELHLELGELDPTSTLISVSAIGPGGEILAESAENPWSMSWDGRPGDQVYLRLRFSRAEDGDEDRLWISPWFAERRCGCATGGGAGWWSALLAVSLVARARRRPGGPTFQCRP